MKGFCWIAVGAIASLCFANIDADIAANQNKLVNAQNQERAISKKLDELGRAINAKNAELTRLGKQIETLQQDIAQNQGKSQIQEKTLKDSQQKQATLLNQKRELEEQIIKLLTQSIAFRMIVERENNIDSIQGVVEFEIYRILHTNAKNSIRILNAEQSILNNEITKITSTISQIQNSIKTQTSKKDKLQAAKEQQKATLSKMKNELQTYDEQLKAIVKERKSLDEILSRLNIVKERKQGTQSQQAFLNNQKDPKSIKAPKQFGTSYRDVPTIRYKGAKTFPPLESYTIEKPFGPYFDPVYKFKIFNAAVMFNPKSRNASVKNVLDGKVVYAKDAPGLKKVIIIEHANAIHTIYAYMDRIESSIKVGNRVQKGAILGRVDERLSFEITQKDKHINPAEFIKLN